jgi:CheY-like chemotaxis protein
MSSRGVILLAEDNENDVLLIRRAFEQAGITHPIHRVADGEEAIAYLQGVGQYADRQQYPLPQLFFLDLKMPRFDGFEVLTWIRQQPGLQTLRTIVLTSSEDMYDVNRAYDLGANSFLVKPMEFERFKEVSKGLKNYWLLLDKAPLLSLPAQPAQPRAPSP